MKLSEWLIPSSGVQMANIQLKELILNCNLLKVLSDNTLTQTSSASPDEILIVLEMFDKTLKLAEQLAIEAIFKNFEREGCLDNLEMLQQHQNTKVKEKVIEIITWYGTVDEL